MTRGRKIIITKEDYHQLQAVLNSDHAAVLSDQPYLRALRGELHKAKVVESGEVPSDVVTMNSTIRLRHMTDREEDVYTPVYPRDADIAGGKLSILAPIGTAILGYRVGDSISWEVPSGTIRVRIEELLFQPKHEALLV